MFGSFNRPNTRPKSETKSPNNGDKAKLAQAEAILRKNKEIKDRLVDNQEKKGSVLTLENLQAVAKASGSQVEVPIVDQNKMTYHSGVWLTNQQIAELNKVKEESEEKKRQEAEGDDTKESKPNIFQRFKNKLFGQKEVEEIKNESKEKSTDSPYQLPDKILTIASINKVKSVLLKNLIDITTSRFNTASKGEDPKLLEKLKQKVPEIINNPDFRNFLGHNLHTQQKSNNQELSDVSKMSFKDVVLKLREYNGLQNIGQTDLIARFFLSQVSVLAKATIKYSEYVENDHYMAKGQLRVGEATQYKKTQLWDDLEQAKQRSTLKEALIGKYLEGGVNENIFKTIKEILGDGAYQETIDQMFPLGLMQNLKYNEEDKKVDTVQLDPEFVSIIESILSPKISKPQDMTAPLNNVTQINSRNQTNPPLRQSNSNVIPFDKRNGRSVA